jgi:hypothetical protein
MSMERTPTIVLVMGSSRVSTPEYLGKRWSQTTCHTHGVKMGTTVSQHAHRLPFLSQILVAVVHWHFQCFPIAGVPGHFQWARRAAPVRVHSPSWVLASLQHTTGARSRGCSPRRGRRRRLQSDVSETTLLPTTKHLPAWMNCEVAVAGVCAAVVSAMVPNELAVIQTPPQ